MLVFGEKYEVVVDKILPRGAIVKLSDNSTEFIHISNLSDDFVNSVSDVVSVGQSLITTCIRGRAKPFELRVLSDKPIKKLSLDDMIEKVNKDYQDKMKDSKKRSDRYNNHKRRSYQ